MNVCIGTICGMSVAYISELPGVNPEFMPEGIYKLIALLDKMYLDNIAADEIKYLAKYYENKKDKLNWCKYECKKREITAMYNNGKEEYFSSLDDFVIASNCYESVKEPEGNQDSVSESGIFLR